MRHRFSRLGRAITLLLPVIALAVFATPSRSSATSTRRYSIILFNETPYSAWVTFYSDVIGIRKQMGTGKVKADGADYLNFGSSSWFSRLRVELHAGDTVYCDTDMEATATGQAKDTRYTVHWKAATKKCFLTSEP
jgi:hypothetical protein